MNRYQHFACLLVQSLVGLILLWVCPTASQTLIFPTGNTELFNGNDSLFYQRTAAGRAQSWRGGCYGFVRNPRTLKEETVFTRFHEGIDIRPLYRDAEGNPLDSVVAVADGTVVRTSLNAGASNYGRYVVVEHIFDGSPYYTLYAHLNEIWTTEGASIRQGEPLGKLGYTGAGINRARAHLHFEFTMLLNDRFQTWYEPLWPNDSNEQGIYNGMNLVGVDVGSLYMALCENPELTIPAFLAREETFYKVLLPRTERLDLLNRYPWLLDGNGSPDDASWLVSFNRSGLPVRVGTSTTAVEGPTLIEIRDSGVNYRYMTKGRVRGTRAAYELTTAGLRYMNLLTASAQPVLGAAAGEERPEDMETE